MISIKGLDKAKVLKELYYKSKFLDMKSVDENYIFTEEEARELLKTQTYFENLYGRVMKVELAGEELDPYLYDRDNGEGAAALVISELIKIEQVTEEYNKIVSLLSELLILVCNLNPSPEDDKIIKDKLKEVIKIMYDIDVSIPDISGKLLQLCIVIDTLSNMVHSDDRLTSTTLIELQSYKLISSCYKSVAPGLESGMDPLILIIIDRLKNINRELHSGKYQSEATIKIMTDINTIMDTIYNNYFKI